MNTADLHSRSLTSPFSLMASCPKTDHYLTLDGVGRLDVSYWDSKASHWYTTRGYRVRPILWAPIGPRPDAAYLARVGVSR